MAAGLEAKKAGKIRYIGFTGHKDPVVHLRTLEIAAQHHFRFDAVQMPLNVMDAHFRSFEQKVLPVLVKEEIGVLGMKPLASGAILETKAVTAIECLHYALNLPTSIVITGMDAKGNPIAGRAVWTGTSGAYVTTTAVMPAAAAGQNIRLRWRMGSDTKNSAPGWSVDTVVLAQCQIGKRGRRQVTSN
jgi:tRNA nucleotidyltransferase/poly(A) polymerase